MNYAVNKNELLRNGVKNNGKIASGTVYPGSWVFNDEIESYPYNPQKALKLLHEAGWRDTNNDNILDKDGIELEFTVLFIEKLAVDEKTLKHIKVDLHRIGVSMQAEKYSTKEFNNSLVK